MKYADIDHSSTNDLASLGKVLITFATSESKVQVWLIVPTEDKGNVPIIRHIDCSSVEQAQSVARLWNAVWCEEAV